MPIFKMQLEDALVGAVATRDGGMMRRKYDVVSRRSPLRDKSVRASVESEEPPRAMGQMRVVLLMEFTGDPSANEAEIEHALDGLPTSVAVGGSGFGLQVDDYSVARGETANGTATDEVRATIDIIPE